MGRGDGDTLPLLKGTLDLLVLKALTFEDLHGYGIVSWLEARSGGSIGVDDSAVYQALHRLEGRGLVEARWGRTENNRRARWYSLTGTGRRHLLQESEIWERYTRQVSDILALDALGPEPGSGT